MQIRKTTTWNTVIENPLTLSFRYEIKCIQKSCLIYIFLNLYIFFCILGYPERLDMKPVGPRDPPSHFQRKQEYL